MATKVNSEGRVPANYPGLFNARENRMITHNYCAVFVTAEDYEVKADDGVTHLVVDPAASDIEISLPNAALSKGRLLKMYIPDNGASGSVTVAGLVYSPGVYELFCSGDVFTQVSIAAPGTEPTPVP
jgi:hypothetical protein